MTSLQKGICTDNNVTLPDCFDMVHIVCSINTGKKSQLKLVFTEEGRTYPVFVVFDHDKNDPWSNVENCRHIVR